MVVECPGAILLDKALRIKHIDFSYNVTKVTPP